MRRFSLTIFGWLVLFLDLQGESVLDPAQILELRPLWPDEIILLKPVSLTTGIYHFEVPAHSEAHFVETTGKFITVQIRKGRATVPLEETDFLERLEKSVAQMMGSERALVESTRTKPAPTKELGALDENKRELLLEAVLYLRIGKKIETIRKEERSLSVGHTLSNSSGLPHSVVGNGSEGLTLGFAQVNEMFGLPLWSGQSLWSESAAEVAQRLEWTPESAGTNEVTYRYFPHRQVRVLGVQPFCLALHAISGKVREVVLVFTNQFDPSSFHADQPTANPLIPDRMILASAETDLGQAVNRDAWTVSLALTQLLGMPGNRSSDDPGEEIRCWDWRGNRLLLSVASGKYVVLRIIASELHEEPDGFAKKALDLSDHVEHRPNGDTLIAGIPMVNQGQSEFCGPATWERCLRYRGIPADMYVLGMIGRAGVGGSVSLLSLDRGVGTLLSRYGCGLEQVSPELSIKNLSSYIDRGVPLVWACNNPPSLEVEITRRSVRRLNNGDGIEYKNESLAFQAKYQHDFPADGPLQNPSAYSHLRLIIGYNAEAREVAVSDSYGAWAKERWMTLLEARAVSLGYLRVIR